MNNLLIAGAAIIILPAILYVFVQSYEKNTNLPQEERVIDAAAADDETMTESTDKLKADTFTGTLEVVNTGCYIDAECFVEVDGKHVTVLSGMRLMQQEVGSIIGADGIGGLEAFIGQEVEVYAQESGENRYTLYGSSGFYIKAK